MATPDGWILLFTLKGPSAQWWTVSEAMFSRQGDDAQAMHGRTRNDCEQRVAEMSPSSAVEWGFWNTGWAFWKTVG
jgi:hypothetical protein